jgi:integrase
MNIARVRPSNVMPVNSVLLAGIKSPSFTNVASASLLILATVKLLSSINVIGTGLRLGELLALMCDDINNNMITVNKNIKNVKISDKWTILLQNEPKTKKSNRTVPIPQNILSELEKHKSQQSDIKSKADNMYNDNNIIFATDFGTYIDPSNLNRIFIKLLKKLT